MKEKLNPFDFNNRNTISILLKKAKIIFPILGLILLSFSSSAQKVTIKGKNIPLRSVFAQIKKQTAMSVFARKDVLDSAKPVSFDGSTMTIEEVLTKITKDQPIQYKILGKEIIISKKDLPKNNKSTSILQIQEQQTQIIEGYVYDDSGKPIPNASITSSENNVTAVSNADGRFSIRSSISDVLIVKMLGFENKSIKVRSAEPLNISMLAKTLEVESVVVTGLFNRPKENFTGAATTMKGVELKSFSSNNLLTAVSAMDPSFRILPNLSQGSNINALPEVQIRGTNSMPNLSGELSANPNQPLFILDGFEVSLQRVVDLDLNNIETVTILKDAAATSIYGSRGANGVMVINSITPASGKVRVTVNNDYRITTPDLSVYSMLNAQEKLDFERRVGIYDQNNPRSQYFYDVIYNERLKAIESGANTDWLAQPVQTGQSNRTSLYLNGGDNSILYGIQLTGDLQSGVMKGQKRNNYSGQFDLTYKVSKLRFQNSIRIFQNTSNESPYGSFSNYVNQNPYWKPFDENGNIKPILETIQTGELNFTRYANPLYDAHLNIKNQNQYFGISNNFQLRYDITAGLFLESNLSLNKQSGSNDQFYPAQHSRFNNVTDVTRKGSYSAQNNNSLGYESRTMINYNLKKNKHLVFSTFGFDIASTNQNYHTITAEGFAFDKLDNLLFATQYELNSKPSGDESKVNRVGLLANASYSFDNKYLVDASLRRDGSSQFGADKRFGTFWSFGAGWNIHNESFIKDIEQINRFKIRSSYGSSGSINIPAYQAQTRYTFGTNNIYNGQLGAEIISLANKRLSWQDVRTLNVGADIVLFNENLDLKFDHYRSITNNTITTISLPSSTGFTSYVENLGKVENIGYEIGARYKVINNPQEGIIWSVNASAFSNKNTLKELSNRLKAVNDKLNNESPQRVPNILLTEGQSINTIYTVQSLGVDPSTGAEIFLDRFGNKTFIWNTQDKVASGKTDPKWNGLFGTQFIYKGFTLQAQFDYKFGGQLYNQTLINRVENVNPLYNVDQRAYDLGWTQLGDRSDFTKIMLNKPPTRLTSRFVQNENTLNLNSLSLSYNFYKSAFINRMGLSSFQITAITNDLYRASSIQIERGTDNPFARTYSLSLRCTF
ncbi:SusC/RagA family TonB-linked outer membrane protein [Sphingobacterium bovistauri]|uniref:SusC/RagA family TonB-linked outer membrane protein n=1 Tax=Sphingobacterium bovistauri TaxID=2781959 RepID=A0ABS7Z9B9_9SPHI|nr:SusC/RagA family TonB-linked outer membrane protein [Sphingobacterium bovistauri]MCA5006754.1 SusC/RagA family TonB-linked outer membrane protein [Sphingobacterium bovistauri]